MALWSTDGEFFRRGLRKDAKGQGAAWARIAIAARVTSLWDAKECARRAYETNPEAWAPWYTAFFEDLPDANHAA